MNTKIKLFIIIFLLLTILTSCDKNLKNPTQTPEAGTIQNDPNELFEKFYQDTNIPSTLHSIFTKAINDDPAAQSQIYRENFTQIYEKIFPFGYTPNSGTAHYNIGMMYYTGIDEIINLSTNKPLAFLWFKEASKNGNLDSTIMMGDMAKNGDGIPVDNSLAFSFYLNAFEIEPNETAYQRLGECYEKGIGTECNQATAYDYYIQSVLKINPSDIYSSLSALYSMISIANQTNSDTLLLLKAAGSLNSIENEQKQAIVKHLYEHWDNSTDPIVTNLKNQIQPNPHFSNNFIEEFMKTSYSYSYSAFSEKYAVKPNRTFEDAQKIQFLEPPDFDYDFETYLQQKNYDFYEYDFNGDGENEIGIPISHGSGGHHSTYSFDIYKKNSQGLYEIFSQTLLSGLFDSLQLIKFEDKYYFIANPETDYPKIATDLMAQSIDVSGKTHVLYLDYRQYAIKHILTKTNENFSVGFDALISKTHEYAHEAISAAKTGTIYSPDDEVTIDGISFSQLTHPSYRHLRNILFSADINNDGATEIIHKGLTIANYEEYTVYDIYKNIEDFATNAKPIHGRIPPYEYTGPYSLGNIYDKLPMPKKIIQLWTTNYNGKTYVSALMRNKFFYSLQTFLIENEETSVVSQSMFLDEVQNMNLRFETPENSHIPTF